MPRFFVEPGNVSGGRARLSPEDTRHADVLRLRPGEEITVCDGRGTDYTCAVSGVEGGTMLLDVLSASPSAGEPALSITLFQGLPKTGKMELIIQKCVELGVSVIVPVETERAVARAAGKSGQKAARWQKLSEEAAKQCGRGVIPRVSGVVPLDKALELAGRLDSAFVAYENEPDLNLKDAFVRAGGNRTGIFIGPEGGFSADEIERCQTRGVTPVSLGRRVLRTETAGFVAVIILLYT